MINPTYYKHTEIDKQKWDQCIRESNQAIIYAESVYLDYMTGEWDALVYGDYEAVMPLCSRKKWGIRYLYQPAFVQQGGIFTAQPINAALLEGFINACKHRFKFAEIHLNFGNDTITQMGNNAIIVRPCNNFLLNLNAPYKKIASEYQGYFTERLRRADKNGHYYSKDCSIDDATNLFESLYKNRMKGVKERDWQHFNALCKYYDTKGRVIVRAVWHSASNEQVAMILLLKDDNRIYNMMSSITDKGKKLLANYFLYNEVISEFSEQPILFDFEGSDIPGVSYFYEKIASQNQLYYFVKYNKLPFLLRIFKA